MTPDEEKREQILRQDLNTLQARVEALEAILKDVKKFSTHIKIDDVPYPVDLFVVDKTGKLAPPKPTFAVVPSV